MTLSRISAFDGRVLLRPHRQAEGDVVEDRHVPEQGVVLEDEADLALAHMAARSRPRRRRGSLPPSGVSSPAMMRSSVVLPEPDGPSRATSSPAGTVEADVLQGGEAAELLADIFDLDAHIVTFRWHQDRGSSLAVRPSSIASCCRTFHSTTVLTTRVTRASRASSEATAKAAAKLYSL